jgi:hypothetical protein
MCMYLRTYLSIYIYDKYPYIPYKVVDRQKVVGYFELIYMYIPLYIYTNTNLYTNICVCINVHIFVYIYMINIHIYLIKIVDRQKVVGDFEGLINLFSLS